AAGVAADQDDIRAGFGNASGDGADAGLGHELDRDRGAWVDLAQVVDELGQVFDAVDVVVRWRRDERDAGRGVADSGDLGAALVPGQLAALAGLGALRHLDLQLVGRYQVSRRDAEAGRGHLLDTVVGFGAVAGRVLAALTRVAERVQPVHGNGHG